MAEIENERNSKANELDSLRQENPRADPESLNFLGELPVGEADFEAAPNEILRWLFEAFRLEVRYDKPSGWATCQITLSNDALAELALDSAKLPQLAGPTDSTETGKRSLLVRAPNPTSFELRWARGLSELYQLLD